MDKLYTTDTNTLINRENSNDQSKKRCVDDNVLCVSGYVMMVWMVWCDGMCGVYCIYFLFFML